MESSSLRVLIVSDVHYDGVIYRGVDTSEAWKWLLRLVRTIKPDLLLGCGDLGRIVNVADLEKVARRTMFLTIYGNHDRVGALKSARNILGELKGKRILMEDGKVYEIKGLTVAGINGVVVTKTDPWAPRPKSKREFIDSAKRIQKESKGKRLDVLLLHETPYYPELISGIRENVGSLAAREVIEMVRPRVAIGGHAHLEPQLVKREDTVLIHLDSSQLRRSYLTLEIMNNGIKITLYEDGEIIESTQLKR
ncbi:hypothetical protein IPA_09090 [Ignicoccus pacificus DSM 13166]|uniref:Calcineurin-like phosphoesterase domain-containing protein n=1 Tax=Ignicoccus pacificus DSM 13166 TaxID=940294 RepID=A0A977KC20_9CREN|nr:hypothetical protein IPA_09090 [Ignicoccus pacificus DSM 13166]